MNKENRIKSFTDLYAWQKSHLLVLEIYKITKEYPKSSFSLIDQSQRAAVSVTSNIAEGFGRQTYKEKIQFYYMAQGSISELKNLVLIARDIGYIKLSNDLIELSNDAHRLLQGLITASKQRK